MKTLFNLFVVFTIMFGNASFAQEGNSMLWEISGNGLKQPSYVQGTMHMLCAKDFQIKQKTLDALDKAQKLVLEIDYSNPAELAAMQKMMQADRKLSEQLSVSQKDELQQVLKTYNTNLEAVDSYSIQALYTLIGQKSIPCPQHEVKMFEVELLARAAKSGKTFGGLEKVVDQIAALAGSYDLDETIRQLKAGDEYAILAQQMTKAFNEENLPVLDTQLKDRRFMNDMQEELMLNRRNRNWVEKAMPTMMEKETVLFAVGGGHLWGKEGLINLLKERGYTLTPVR